MKASIVIGLGYGDEGKGLMTSLIASKYGDKALVVRFNGGHQAGHTVVKDDINHVFSNFGAGTLNGSDSYWSAFCTFDPIGASVELQKLRTYGISLPTLYVHPLCPVVTPFDKLWNQFLADVTQHGSVGVGFGTTVQRHEKFFKIHAQDLEYPNVLKAKMQNVIGYYKNLGMNSHFINNHDEVMHKFLKDIDTMRHQSDCIRIAKPNPKHYDHIVFEGAQGVLLDMDFGFFPNVTRSNTTSKNALEMVNEMGLSLVDIYYMTRAYATRHGNGYFSGEEHAHQYLHLKNNEHETNVKNEYQGEFRKAPMDIRMIDYALNCDNHYSKHINSKKIVITCCDQIDTNNMPVITDENEIQSFKIDWLMEQAPFVGYDICTNGDAEGKSFGKVVTRKFAFN